MSPRRAKEIGLTKKEYEELTALIQDIEDFRADLSSRGDTPHAALSVYVNKVLNVRATNPIEARIIAERMRDEYRIEHGIAFW